jgi:hypothetical protein
MTNEEMARKAAEINFEIAIVHGLGGCKVGFEWHGLWIHNPYVDPNIEHSRWTQFSNTVMRT